MIATKSPPGSSSKRHDDTNDGGVVSAHDDVFSELGIRGGQPLSAPTRTSNSQLSAPVRLPTQPPQHVRATASATRDTDSDEPESGFGIGRTLWLAGCLALAAYFVYPSLPESWRNVFGSSSASQQQQVALPAESTLRTAKIEDVQVGDRVVGTNPIREQVEHDEPDPATWRKISFHMRKESGRSLWIDLLRPIEWIEENGVAKGKVIHLNLAEMGAVGDAEVTSLVPCPAIKPGTGTIVTGKFVHQADATNSVVRLHLEGQKEATGVTTNHPYWSEERQRYVPVGELRIGEVVNTKRGPRRVTAVTPQGSFSGLLYNLETLEHVYRVGSLGTLVHNACPMTPDQQALKELADEASLGGRRPLTADQGNTVMDWADETGYPGARAGPGDVSGSHWQGPHIHVPGVGSGHIPVQPGVRPR